MRTRFALSMAVVAALLYWPASQASPSPCALEPDADAVAACIGRALEASWGVENLSGVLAVRKHGRDVFVSYGSRSIDEPEQAPTEQTLFRIASMTKPVTAAVALSYVEAGELTLDSKVRTFVPELTQAEAATLEIRHLIEHTSGLPSSNELPDPAAFGTLSFAELPGQREEYSNLNYYILGLVLENMTGQPLETLIQERIPALRDHFFIDRFPASHEAARGTTPGLLGWWDAADALPERVFDRHRAMGAGGGVTTPAAMLAFVDQLFRGRVPGLKKIPADVADGADREIGWARLQQILWHNGALHPYGWQSVMAWHSGQELAVVFLSNRDEAAGSVDTAVLSALHTGRVEPPHGSWPTRVRIAMFAMHLLPILAAFFMMGAVLEKRRYGWALWSVGAGLVYPLCFVFEPWWAIVMPPAVAAGAALWRFRHNARRKGS